MDSSHDAQARAIALDRAGDRHRALRVLHQNFGWSLSKCHEFLDKARAEDVKQIQATHEGEESSLVDRAVQQVVAFDDLTLRVLDFMGIQTCGFVKGEPLEAIQAELAAFNVLSGLHKMIAMGINPKDFMVKYIDFIEASNVNPATGIAEAPVANLQRPAAKDTLAMLKDNDIVRDMARLL